MKGVAITLSGSGIDKPPGFKCLSMLSPEVKKARLKTKFSIGRAGNAMPFAWRRVHGDKKGG